MGRWKEILDIIAPPDNRKKYTELIRLTGGEPTFHKDFIRIARYVDSFGIPFSIFTNGRWPDPLNLANILKNRKNLVGILVSLHGDDAFTHGCFSNTDEKAFEETCSNIKLAAGLGIEVFTNTVITKFNIDKIERIIKFSKSLGASCAVFNRLISRNSNIAPDNKALKKAINLIESLNKKGELCHIGNCVPFCFAKNSIHGANSGIEHCTISPEGFIRPSNHTDIIFGNIFDKPIEEIWKNEIAEKYRDSIPETCRECVLVERCRGGIRMADNSDYFQPDPLMTEPVTSVPEDRINLDPDSVPFPDFNIRKTDFGYIACLLNFSIPFTNEAGSMLHAIDGKSTISAIYEKFGEPALEVIAYLYREGFIWFDNR